VSRVTFITLLSAVILSFASLFHWQSTQVETPVAQQQQSSNESDFYIVNAKTTQFNSTGQPDHHLEADEIKHFPIGDFTIADNPDITLFRKDGIPWYISAEQGRMTQANDTIELWDNVALQRDTPDNVLDVSTSKLTLEAATKIAHTDRDVVINDNATHIEATGMKAHIEEDKIKFLSNVRVTHDPAKVN